MSDEEPGSVIWVTGLSGAGKTTLCRAVWAQLKPYCPELVILDGDAVREAFGHDLGHAEADRRRQIQRMQRLASLLAGQGLRVLVAALYAHPDLLAWNRAQLPRYFEVYLRATLPLLRRRNSKGIYADDPSQASVNVVGVDIPWHAPSRPDWLVDADAAGSPEELAVELMRRAGWAEGGRGLSLSR